MEWDENRIPTRVIKNKNYINENCYNKYFTFSTFLNIICFDAK